MLRQLSDGAVLHVFSSRREWRRQQARRSARRQARHQRPRVRHRHRLGPRQEGRAACDPGHDWSITSVAISPDGTLRAVRPASTATLKLWDIDTGKQCAAGTAMNTAPMARYSPPTGTTWSPAAATTDDQGLGSRQRPRGAPLRGPLRHGLRAGAFPRRPAPAPVSLDGTARLWDMDTGAEIASSTGQTGPLYAVAFAADGTLLTGGYDRTIRDLACRWRRWQRGAVCRSAGVIAAAAVAIGESRRDSQSPPSWGRCPAGQRGARRIASVRNLSHYVDPRSCHIH